MYTSIRLLEHVGIVPYHVCGVFTCVPGGKQCCQGHSAWHSHVCFEHVANAFGIKLRMVLPSWKRFPANIVALVDHLACSC